MRRKPANDGRGERLVMAALFGIAAEVLEQMQAHVPGVVAGAGLRGAFSSGGGGGGGGGGGAD